MAVYSTKQRKILINYLSEHSDEGFTAKQLAERLADEGISLSAVYRNLAQQEKSGMIHRFTKDGSREIYYRYSGAERCKDCLHLSCKKCGKTYHMHGEEAEMIKKLALNENFNLDIKGTVLYGTCKDCGAEEKK